MPTAFLNFTHLIFFLKIEHQFYFIQEDWSGETGLLNDIILHWIVGFCVIVCIWKGLFSLGSVFWHEMSLEDSSAVWYVRPQIICCLVLTVNRSLSRSFSIYSYHLPHINIGTLCHYQARKLQQLVMKQGALCLHNFPLASLVLVWAMLWQPVH